jgi:hypothetical protein
MKTIIFSFALLANVFIANAQVPKKIVVEHFTNSRCGNCASRNPGFYTNLQTQSNTLHIAFHPSSPYSNCIFSQHNSIQNDARTNYYSIYGGTPRLVIQGTIVSGSANYSANTIFLNYLLQTTPWQITVLQTNHQTDSITTKIIIKKMSATTRVSAKLLVALAEDTVFYASPNGEAEHYDVFRKSMSAISGNTINLPANIGDSIIYNFSSSNNAAWDFKRIYTMAILQDSSTKEVLQAEECMPNPAKIVVVPTSINNQSKQNDYEVVFLNNQIKIIGLTQKNIQVKIHTMYGQAVQSSFVNANQNSFAVYLPNGNYIVSLIDDKSMIQTNKIIVK